MSIAPSRPIPAYPEPGQSSYPVEVTYDEFMAMPVTKQRVEVVDGVLYAMPAARYRHQQIQNRLGRGLEDFVAGRGLGVVLQAPADVVIRTHPKLRVRQPDVLYFSDARSGFHFADDLDRLQDSQVAPDLVIEVLSPGQDERTLADKLADYASILVDEVWFADQEAKAIRVLARECDHYVLAGTFGVGDRVVSAVLPGVDLDVATVFA